MTKDEFIGSIDVISEREEIGQKIMVEIRKFSVIAILEEHSCIERAIGNVALVEFMRIARESGMIE